MAQKFPKAEIPQDYFLTLAQMVAKTSWLPHPDTVKEMGGAAFPALRARKEYPRFTHACENEKPVGMYDDNVTPAWALIWAHDIKGTRPKGWTVAHVWPETDSVDSFTHLANLAMIPECFGTLTDKTGPLTVFLRWHAWTVYHWKPGQQTELLKPDGYDAITWRYLEYAANPRALIRQRLIDSDNQRTRILRPIMESRQML
jgi:hypothetical protein